LPLVDIWLIYIVVHILVHIWVGQYFAKQNDIPARPFQSAEVLQMAFFEQSE
jgi:hypothetical protein